MEEFAIFIYDDIFGSDWSREEMSRTSEALGEEPVSARDHEGTTEDEDSVVEVFPCLLHILIEVGGEEEANGGQDQKD